METYRSGHNGADSKHSRVCHISLFETPLFIGVYAMCVCTFRILHLAVFSQFRYQALPLQFYMETYRSGHNGADSKSVREQSPASSNLAVSAKDNRNLRIAVVFFCYGLIFVTACDIINLISELIYFQHLFFIGRGYKNGRGNLDHLLDICEPMKILILVQFSL